MNNLHFTIYYFAKEKQWRVENAVGHYWTAGHINQIPLAILGMLREEAKELQAFINKEAAHGQSLGTEE